MHAIDSGGDDGRERRAAAAKHHHAAAAAVPRGGVALELVGKGIARARDVGEGVDRAGIFRRIGYRHAGPARLGFARTAAHASPLAFFTREFGDAPVVARAQVVEGTRRIAAAEPAHLVGAQGARRQGGFHRLAVGFGHVLVGPRKDGVGADLVLDGGRGLGAIEACGRGAARRYGKAGGEKKDAAHGARLALWRRRCNRQYVGGEAEVPVAHPERAGTPHTLIDERPGRTSPPRKHPLRLHSCDGGGYELIAPKTQSPFCRSTLQGDCHSEGQGVRLARWRGRRPPLYADMKGYLTSLVSKSAGMVISSTSKSSEWSISLCLIPGGW